MKKRALSPDEIAALPASFTQSFDIARVRLIDRTHNPFAKGKILVRNYNLYWKGAPQDFTALPLSMRSTLIHELCHVWQYETGRLTAWRYISRPKNWTYGYHYSPSKSFDDYPIEKQADLLQDWHHMNHGYPPYRHHHKSRPPSLAQINAAVPFAWPQKTSADEIV